MLRLCDIENSINQNDISKLEEYLKYIVENQYTKSYELLVNGLMKTNNAIVRNMIALALSDVRHQGIVEKIIELLTSDRTKGNRGTLLYSLEPLDYIDHIEYIFDLLKDDTFEVRWEAFELIKMAGNNISVEIKKRMVDSSLEKINMYQDIIEILDN